jgi:hypothetical protein
MVNSGTNDSVNRPANPLRNAGSRLSTRFHSAARRTRIQAIVGVAVFRDVIVNADQELAPVVEEPVLGGHTPPVSVDLGCEVGIVDRDGR